MKNIKFSTWARTECSSCSQEFEVTRTEPKSFKNISEIICSECKDYSNAYKDGFEAGQQQYKSIVKAVDPDNLPEGRVLAICKEGEPVMGEFEKDWGLFLCTYNESKLIAEITHYIETKDIIKLLG